MVANCKLCVSKAVAIFRVFFYSNPSGHGIIRNVSLSIKTLPLFATCSVFKLPPPPADAGTLFLIVSFWNTVAAWTELFFRTDHVHHLNRSRLLRYNILPNEDDKIFVWETMRNKRTDKNITVCISSICV